VTDEQPAPGDLRVFYRLLAAGLTRERIEEHLAAGRIRVDGELVTDPYRPAPPLDALAGRGWRRPEPLAVGAAARELLVARAEQHSAPPSDAGPGA
jgi:hypothetical protein